ncbi:MAG: aminoacyl-tRNA hydrolase [Clostridia bacterium]|nr:aminoacyl-tRNA hydrolase [Clostridia bacterium]
MDSIYIVIGLGNPGARYEYTRHNVGFIAVDLLAQKYGIKISKIKHKAILGEGSIEGAKVVLVKPQTYMNLSGESVREVLDWYKAPIKNVIIIYDDIDLAVGKIRIRPKGSSGTHNGMRSVLYQIQTDEFPRVRIGIGKPPEGWQLADFVLSKFTQEEKRSIEEGITNGAEAASAIIKSGIESAMNKYNSK